MSNTFYLDMDGVMADWETAASNFLGRPLKDYVTGHYKNTPEEWLRIRDQSRFYRHLPLMPRAQELADLGRRYRDELGWHLKFLTAVPKNDDMPWAFYDKVLWALDYFPDIPVMFGPHSQDKHRHCQQGDILVDDRRSNCEEWTRAGGWAIRVLDGSLDSAIAVLRADLAVRLRK